MSKFLFFSVIFILYSTTCSIAQNPNSQQVVTLWQFDIDKEIPSSEIRNNLYGALNSALSKMPSYSFRYNSEFAKKIGISEATKIISTDKNVVKLLSEYSTLDSKEQEKLRTGLHSNFVIWGNISYKKRTGSYTITYNILRLKDFSFYPETVEYKWDIIGELEKIKQAVKKDIHALFEEIGKDTKIPSPSTQKKTKWTTYHELQDPILDVPTSQELFEEEKKRELVTKDGYYFYSKNCPKNIPRHWRLVYKNNSSTRAYGYWDTQKDILLVGCEYDWIDGFSEDLAIVKKGEKYGYIDKTGVEVIKVEFIVAEPCGNGKIRVIDQFQRTFKIQ